MELTPSPMAYGPLFFVFHLTRSSSDRPPDYSRRWKRKPQDELGELNLALARHLLQRAVQNRMARHRG